MYKRVEQIEEENLDWNQYARASKKRPVQEENVIFASLYKSKKTLWQSITEFDIEKKLMHFFEKNIALASSLGILLLPYFVGFLLAYTLFYNYGGMTFIGFLSIEKDHLVFQLWSIGAYLFVTTWVFWAFSQVVKSSKQLLTLSYR